MQVSLRFDTETESIENLTKLVDALQKLIAHRTGKPIPNNSQNTSQPKEAPKKVTSRTGGGCRVIPYEDMSEKMTSLLSGKRY